MSSNSPSSRFLAFLLEVSEEITDDKLEDLKFLCSRKISKQSLTCINKPHELFNELITKDLLHENDTCYLEELLEGIKEHRLKESVVKFHHSRHISEGDEGSRLANGSTCTGVEILHAGLPLKVWNFTGRDNVVAEIVDAITKKKARLLILKAPPGFGKSAVATEVGHHLYKSQQVSVVFVSLRKCTSLVCCCTAILHALDGNDAVMNDDVVLQTQNRLATALKVCTVLILDNAEDLQDSSSGEDFAKFVEYLGNNADMLHVFLTSRHDLSLVSFHYECNLPKLDPLASAELLVAMSQGKIKNDDIAKELGIQCGGNPLLLRIAAKLVSFTGFDPKSLAMDLKKNLYCVLKQEGAPDCLRLAIRVFLRNLSKNLQISLLKLSNFPARFTKSDSEFLFDSSLECRIEFSNLYGNALIQNEDGKYYSLHPVIQAFCREEQERLECAQEGRKAEEVFIQHHLEQLKQLHKEFVSKNCQESLQKFRRVQMNICQAYKSCLQNGSSEAKGKCIDAFNESVNLLGKVLQPRQCIKLYARLHIEATAMQDRKRVSDCLVSLGFRHMCDGGHAKFSQDAFDAFNDAYEIQQTLSKKERETEIYAHCTSKLGLCHMLKDPGCAVNRKKAERLFDKAVQLRHRLGDQVLLGASYCDKAIAARLCDKHGKAIHKLTEKCLPLYQAHLGDHPWTATIYSYISDSHLALGNIDAAVDNKRRSLQIRIKVLGSHQDTARSHIQLGRLLLTLGKTNEAVEVFKTTLRVQEEVLGIHSETANTYNECASVLEKLGRQEEARDMRKRVKSYQGVLNRREFKIRQISMDVKERTKSFTTQNVSTRRQVLLVIFSIVVVFAGLILHSCAT